MKKRITQGIQSRPLKHIAAVALLAASAAFTASGAQAWTLKEAAQPYSGTTIKAIFLDRPGYKAAQTLIPQFEKETGIKVRWEVIPYENTREKEVLNFVGGGDQDIVLVDVVWIGEFASNKWLVPIKKFTDDPKLADPSLNLQGFFPILLDSFGTWDKVTYGLPFDNYSGLMFYNKCMLKDAGFDAPPKTWDELLNTYAPKLTKGDKFAFALQSRRGETQSADSFMRVLWPNGGSLLDAKFKSNLMSPQSQAGLEYRQKLMKYMPPGIVDFDHAEAVNALAQGQVAMITEWSAFYPTLTDPSKSKIGNCLAITTEPRGAAGLKPALGGFSLAVNAKSNAKKQAASWLFIQWITSEAMAKPYLEAGGVPARTAVYKDAAVQDKYPFVKPMVESWQGGVPDYRPRFPEWPAVSEVIGEWGSKMMLGQVTVKEGAQTIGQKTEDILKKAGYYDGKKPLLK
ncbi:ABC transporter substrate-binding protein [Caballeronia grimmiae]|uniref:ABC transporter substrate-binding protein n=1 Tax=Caballeronia grimmiae TaxID=1071679 RepID=A0A069PB96_9BURK|nr:sugar ABC transporter substrate-binding protein [Caballeronia grimmiae]KDR34566.1 sugar ABC transporter [Caballeronia grimmiae]GGD80934.1 ABC transporter substrate-binding protein [Caballeronia grimmiae]